MILPPPQIQTLIGLLRNGARLDGRSLFEYREISFAFPQGTTNENGGSCIVKLGANSVLARVSCEVMEPKPFRPSQGMLFVNFDASTLVHLEDSRSTSKVVRAAEEEGRRLSAILQIILRDTIDLDALCIVAWERVFAIRLELRALSFDGNLGDCGALASIMALSTYKRPDVVVTDEGKASFLSRL
ncbi:unnamed protein product [Protopolystoma xenopodis]|uniref:Exoribonuclease phosphorolytic domain-containing protein n=1 Tax=Protopolystoma xenopodis TaxID=117903 RepID=A0A3S4ZYC0_9PLAT|nr:unnamed protein product [Protopolystoma xenopodis]